MLAVNAKAEELQREGQVAYRNKGYEAAMNLFSRALEIPNLSPTVQIRILDNRAAAQEKIGGVALRAALADAKKMIQLQNSSANAYLRAGKILQLQGNDKLALGIYKYGLKKIASNDDDGKKLLEGMHQKVLGRMQGPKAARCFDMMFILPLELVEMILRKLPFHTLMLAQGVSKSWRQFLSTSYQTYNTVDFSAAKRPVSRFALKTCVKRSKGNITKLVTNRLSFSEGEPIIYLATRCKNLSYVEIMGNSFASYSIVEMAKIAENLKTLIVNCATSMSAVAEVMTQCKKLESLECTDVTANVPALWNPDIPMGLRRLLLISSNNSKLQHLRLPELLEQLPGLRELELLDWVGPHPHLDFSVAKDLRVLTIAKTPSLERFPLLPPTIQKLDLSENPRLVCTFEDIAASPLPDLEDLNVCSNPKVKNQIILTLLEPSLNTHSLRVLRMNMCPRLDFDSLDWLLDLGHGDMLEELGVAGCPTFGDQVSRELGKLKALKRLDLSNTRISGIGVLNIVNRIESVIEWLCLDGCESVGYDLVQKIRKMGISVSHRSGGDLRGGKRIRYKD